MFFSSTKVLASYIKRKIENNASAIALGMGLNLDFLKDEICKTSFDLGCKLLLSELCFGVQTERCCYNPHQDL